MSILATKQHILWKLKKLKLSSIISIIICSGTTFDWNEEDRLFKIFCTLSNWPCTDPIALNTSSMHQNATGIWSWSIHGWLISRWRYIFWFHFNLLNWMQTKNYYFQNFPQIWLLDVLLGQFPVSKITLLKVIFHAKQ